jgi:tartrate dehydrogenase/decarboxylase/D-malate dehydrogenase
MLTRRVAVIAGDGVGKEVIPAGIGVLEAAARLDGGFRLEFTELPWGCDHYLREGTILPADAATILREFDAIYLGAIGAPGVPDHVSSGGGQLRLRRELDLFVNLRPIELFDGVQSPLRNVDGAGIDFVCVRENSEGEYSDAGGRVHRSGDGEVAVQTAVFTRVGVERVARYAFELARRRRGRLTNVTKSNALAHTFVFWDEVVESVAGDFPDVWVEHVYADAAAAYFVTRPHTFDVVLASNLFGDLLTDLGAAIQGSIGLAASANLNPSGTAPGMFEPAHGSAPDIAGKGIANPLGAIWSGALLLDELGHREARSAIMRAMKDVLAQEAPKTLDLGGQASTVEVGKAVEEALALRHAALVASTRDQPTEGETQWITS